MVYLTPRSSSSSGMVSPVVPYPGYDQSGTYLDPSPISRLKFEGVDFAEKHKGTIGKWVFKRDGEAFESSRPVPRCPTSQSVENYNRDKHPAIKALMNGTATPRYDTVPTRAKFDGVYIAEKCRVDHMKQILNQSVEPNPADVNTCVPYRTKFEGVEFATKGRKDHVKAIFDEAGMFKRMYTDTQINPFLKSTSNDSPKHIPRCPTSESVGNYQRDRQSANKSVINGQATPRPYAAPNRNMFDGVEFAEKGKRDHMKKIFGDYGKSKPSRTNTGKRTQQMTDSGIYLNGIISNPAVPRQGHAVEALMHTGGIIFDPKPIPRVTTLDAARNFNKDKSGKVNRLLRETGSKTCVHIPGIQDKSPYYQPKMI